MRTPNPNTGKVGGSAGLAFPPGTVSRAGKFGKLKADY
jgi:hypothetical protein